MADMADFEIEVRDKSYSYSLLKTEHFILKNLVSAIDRELRRMGESSWLIGWLKRRRNKMSNLDIEIKELETKIAISIAIHIIYLKSKGQYGSSIVESIQEWETEELSANETEQSTIGIMQLEAFMLELVAKSLKQEAERMAKKEEKN